MLFNHRTKKKRKCLVIRLGISRPALALGVLSRTILSPAMSNFNLNLNTKVIRAVRNGTTISGVEVETSTGARQIINVNAGGKVILPCGSMCTPRILFNSSIGPRDQISTVASGCIGVTLPAQADWINLPVGQNLKDHPIFTLTFNTPGRNATSMLASDFTQPTTDIDLFAQASGPLVQSVDQSEYDERYPLFPGNLQLPRSWYCAHQAVLDSRCHFLRCPRHRQRRCYNIYHRSKDSTMITPTTGLTAASAISGLTTGDHFVGTAMMGESNAGNSVVGTDTKVWGTDNLFVVDASIHPDLVSLISVLVTDLSRIHNANIETAYWKYAGYRYGGC